MSGHGCAETIDNDQGEPTTVLVMVALPGIATSIMEVYQDAHVYDQGQITVLEIMGRNAGWLTAASALAKHAGYGPDLIYLPELPFDMEKFLDEVSDLYKKQKNVIIAVSEGIKDKDGKYISGTAELVYKDSFGHVNWVGLPTLWSISPGKLMRKSAVSSSVFAKMCGPFRF